jgi:hypothetical protein
MAARRIKRVRHHLNREGRSPHGSYRLFTPKT